MVCGIVNMESICMGIGWRPATLCSVRSVWLYMEKILVIVCGYEILVMDEKTAGCVVEYDMRLKDAFACILNEGL